MNMLPKLSSLARRTVSRSTDSLKRLEVLAGAQKTAPSYDAFVASSLVPCNMTTLHKAPAKKSRKK